MIADLVPAGLLGGGGVARDADPVLAVRPRLDASEALAAQLQSNRHYKKQSVMHDQHQIDINAHACGEAAQSVMV